MYMGDHACQNASVEARGQLWRDDSPSTVKVTGMEYRLLGLVSSPLNISLHLFNVCNGKSKLGKGAGHVSYQ